MNLHIFSDGLGFYTTEFIRRSEKIDSEHNIYINYYQPTKGQPDIVTVVPFSIENINQLLSKYLDKLERVFFHYYNIENAYLLGEIKKRKPEVVSVWVFWSAEFYCLPEFIPKLFGPFSKKFLTSKTLYQKLHQKGSNIKRRFTGEPFYNHNRYISSFNLVDYFACLLDSDFDNIKQYSKSSTKRLKFAYLSYEQLIDPAILKREATGTKILVNHSADPILNHYEILELLHEKKVSNTIFLPLAYGPENYKAEISSYAQKWFNEKVEIQDQFLSKYQYAEKLTEVGFAIFNIPVQQGLGNIIPLFWLGAKIFLKKNNPVYIDFKKWGIHVYTIEEDLVKENFGQLLSEEMRLENRKILQDILSDKIVDDYYKNVLHAQ